MGQMSKICSRLSMTTKHSAGTLPVNCYETKVGDPKPVDFTRLAQTVEEISSDQSIIPEVFCFLPSQILTCEGNIVCVRKGSQPPIHPLSIWPDPTRACMLLRTPL